MSEEIIENSQTSNLNNQTQSSNNQNTQQNKTNGYFNKRINTNSYVNKRIEMKQYYDKYMNKGNQSYSNNHISNTLNNSGYKVDIKNRTVNFNNISLNKNPNNSVNNSNNYSNSNNNNSNNNSENAYQNSTQHHFTESSLIKSKLKYLYDVYNQYCNKNNTNNLKVSQLYKLSLDAEIIDDYLTKADVEILYKGVLNSNKNSTYSNSTDILKIKENSMISKMIEMKIKRDLQNNDFTFEMFLDIISKIALKKANTINSLIKMREVERKQEQMHNSNNNNNVNNNVNINIQETNEVRNNYESEYKEVEFNEVLKSIVYKNLINLYEKIITNNLDNDNDSIINETKDKDNNNNNVYIKSKINKNNKNNFNKSSLSLTDYLKNRLITKELLNQDSLMIIQKIKSSSKTIQLLKNLIPVLFEQYKVYFSYNYNFYEVLKNYKKDELCKKGFIQFFRDFEITPMLISQNNLYFIYNKSFNEEMSQEIVEFYLSLIDESYLEKIFINFDNSVFINFLESILRICEVSYVTLICNNETVMCKLKDEKKDLAYQKFTECFSYNDQLSLVLEKMEISEGMQNFRKKCNNTTSNFKNSSLFPLHYEFNSEVIINRLIDSLFNVNNTRKSFMEKRDSNDENLYDNINNLNNNQAREDDNMKLLLRNTRQSLISPGKHKSVLSELAFDYFDYTKTKYGIELKNIFTFYCSYGESVNINKLKSTKFFKFLKDAYLVNSQDYDLQTIRTIEENSTYRKEVIPVSQILTNQGYYLNINDVDTIFFKVILNCQNETIEKKNLIKKERSSIINSDIRNKRNSSVIRLNLNLINETLETEEKATLKSIDYDDRKKKPMRFSMSVPKRASVSGSSTMDFDSFIKAIETIAKKLLPKMITSSAIDLIFENNIYPLLNKVYNRQESMYWKMIQEKENNDEYVSVYYHISYLIFLLFNFFNIIS